MRLVRESNEKILHSSLYLYSKFILRHHFESRVNRRELLCDLSPAKSTLFRSCPNFHAVYQWFSETCYAFKTYALYSSHWLKGWSSGNFHQGSITFKIRNYKVTLNTDLKDNRKIKGICSRDQGLCFWWNIANGHFYDYIILRLPRKLVKKFSVLYFRMGWAWTNLEVNCFIRTGIFIPLTPPLSDHLKKAADLTVSRLWYYASVNRSECAETSFYYGVS